MLTTQAIIDDDEPTRPRQPYIAGRLECETCPESYLLKEVNHRIANNLQLVSSILSVRARQATSADARLELGNAANRIQAVGLLHRRLSRAGITEKVDLAAYIRDLCAEITASIVGDDGTKFVLVSEVADPIFLDPETTTRIGIILTELLTNSVKYAGPKPICSIGLAVRDCQLAISVCDDGPGFGSDLNQRASIKGHGMEILEGLITQARGVLTVEPSTAGARIVVTFTIVRR